jgi:hypothetical protein
MRTEMQLGTYFPDRHLYTCTYYTQTWVLRKRDEKIVETCQVRFFRPVLGNALRDKVISGIYENAWRKKI